jgi:hypothetical protein
MIGRPLAVVVVLVSCFACEAKSPRVSAASPLPLLLGGGVIDDAAYPLPSTLPEVKVPLADWKEWKKNQASQVLCDARAGKVNQAGVDALVAHLQAAKAYAPPEYVVMNAFPIPRAEISTMTVRCDPQNGVFAVNGVGIKPDVILWTGRAMALEGPSDTEASFDLFAASLDSGYAIRARVAFERDPKDNSVRLTSREDVAVANLKRYLPPTTTGFVLTEVGDGFGEVFFVERESPVRGLYTGVRWDAKEMRVAKFAVQ